MIDDHEDNFAKKLHKSHMQLGAMIQKFYDELWKQSDDMKDWLPDDDQEERIKKTCQYDLLGEIIEEFSNIFDEILAR